MATKFRHGQWVLFRSGRELPEAHRARDGRYVGIYQFAGMDVKGDTHPEAIIPVRPDGCNIRVPNTKENRFDLVELAPAEVSDVGHLLEPADIPPGRAPTMAPGWTPRVARREAFQARIRAGRRLASAGDLTRSIAAVLRADLTVLDRLLAESKIDQATYDATMSALEERAEEAGY